MKIFTLPNFITLGNLVCGVFGLISLNNGMFKEAGMLIILALILDFFDGFVARLTKTHSEIGKQLDSLADMVSFGVLPSMILFYLMEGSGYLQYLALVPALSSALRLAKFNIDERQSDSFRGLPTPANAMVIASFPFILEQGPSLINFSNIHLILAAYAVLVSIILISDVPMIALKFKNYEWKGNQFRFVFLILSLALLIGLKFSGIPLILILYIAFSILSNKMKVN